LNETGLKKKNLWRSSNRSFRPCWEVQPSVMVYQGLGSSIHNFHLMLTLNLLKNRKDSLITPVNIHELPSDSETKHSIMW